MNSRSMNSRIGQELNPDLFLMWSFRSLPPSSCPNYTAPHSRASETADLNTSAPRDMANLRWPALETRRLWIVLGRFEEGEEEVPQPLPKAREAGLCPAAVEQVRLAIDQLHHLAREATFELRDRPLDVQEHVQALVHAQALQHQPAIQVRQLFCPRGERRVHLRDAAVGHPPLLGRRHLRQHGADTLLPDLSVRLQSEPVDGLEQSLLFDAQRLQRSLMPPLWARLDPSRLLQPPRLEL
mmetsp:Transcript_37303/g.123568  ORF Transcript_37303/g.123568 Transcript_37303/m.123568 type:complete len:240 (+) Transcript_37303:3-722(+)